MRVTPRRVLLLGLTSLSFLFVIIQLSPALQDPDDAHRVRANIKARRLDHVYNEVIHGQIEKMNPDVHADSKKKGPDENGVVNKPDIWVDKRIAQISNKTGDGLGRLGMKIDWHDYAMMERDLQRQGRGERGYIELTKEELDMAKSKDRRYGYSAAASDLISLDRAIKDIRHPLCASKLYHENLPSTSIIMPFHNEAPSVLLRSLHSIINKTPSKLVTEIILVNDASTHSELQKGSAFSVEAEKLPKVTILYSDTRLGLIAARTLGANQARGEVLTFLDSHIECGYNWLPPLLERIALNWRSVPQPLIDVVDGRTFLYREQPGGLLRGSFSWELLYKRLPITAKERREREDEAAPLKTPVQAGGLFSIHRDWFWELGGYDPFLKIWGAEQYEISFKVWMCGGEMEEVPCSRVGHIYRSHMSFSVPGGSDVIALNHARIAELWMDEYKEYYLEKNPRLRKKSLGEDLEDRRAIRERLKCKSFRWFMQNVAYDQDWYYPAVEPQPYASGKCQSVAFPEKCFHIREGEGGESESVLISCEDRSVVRVEFTWRKEMRKERGGRDCVDLSRHLQHSRPQWFKCHQQGGNQQWLYLQDTQQIKYDGSNLATPLCLSTDASTVYVEHCDQNSQNQKWTFDKVDFSLFRPEMGPPYDKSLTST